jgi:hypothetical protein
VTFEFANESVTVHYAPERITDSFIAKIQALTTDENPDAAATLRALNEAIVQVVTSWDVLESDGGPELAIDMEHVQPLPLVFKTAILKHVFEAMTMGEAPGGASSPRSAATSSPTESTTSSLTDASPSGTSSSPLPSTSA